MDRYPFETRPGPKRRPGLSWVLTAIIALPYVAVGVLGQFRAAPSFSAIAEQMGLGLVAAQLHSVEVRPDIALGAAFVVLLLAAPAAWKGIDLARRLRAPDAFDVLNRDARAPVLFLRAFDDDDVPDTAVVGVLRSVEERLAAALRRIGPMIAIGRPGEFQPRVGAARFYVPDSAWKDAVSHFLEKASAVVLVVGNSQGVLWEVGEALTKVAPQRLLIAFPHILPKTRRGWWLPYMRMVRGFGYSADLLQRMQEERAQRYDRFRARAAEVAGLQLPPKLGPQDGFIDFCADGAPRILPTLPHVLMVNRRADELMAHPDYRRSLRPFLAKLLERKLSTPLVERFFTSVTALRIAMIAFLAAYGAFQFAQLDPRWESAKFLSLPFAAGIVAVLWMAQASLKSQAALRAEPDENLTSPLRQS